MRGILYKLRDFGVRREKTKSGETGGGTAAKPLPQKPDLSRVGTYFGYNRSPLYAAIVVFLFSCAAILITQFLYKTKNKVDKLPHSLVTNG